MSNSNSTTGTVLRHLIELLDGDVQARYDDHGLTYRPRYTPIVRSLELLGPASIRAIAVHAGMTHSAVSQTVIQMARAGLVHHVSGRDGRERIIHATAKLDDMLPRLRSLWAATNQAATELDHELSFPLSSLVLEVIHALEKKPFRERIRDVEASLC